MSILATVNEALRGDLTVEEWKDFGRKLGKLESAINWALGDWLMYGEGRGEFGDTYTIAHELTGRALDVLSQCARTARAFPPGDRVRGASWTLHREALRLPENRRRDGLERAVANGWNRMQLIGHITVVQREALGEIAAGNADVALVTKANRWGSQKPQARKQQVMCPHCHRTFGLRRQAFADADAVAERPSVSGQG